MVADVEIIQDGQQEIKCLIENTAKDQEIARFEPSGRCPERPETLSTNWLQL